MSVAAQYIQIDAERILYVDRGRDTILCTMHEFPAGATLLLRVNDAALAALKADLNIPTTEQNPK